MQHSKVILQLIEQLNLVVSPVLSWLVVLQVDMHKQIFEVQKDYLNRDVAPEVEGKQNVDNSSQHKQQVVDQSCLLLDLDSVVENTK